MNLNFYMPTKIIMDENCIAKHSGVFSRTGKKAMIVTGASSARRNGALDDVTTALRTEGIDFILYDKVMSNPTIDCVYDGAQLARQQNTDLIIAIGGGSPIDAGKAIALLTRQEIARKDLFSGNYTDAVLPMIVIPTTAGTGSEVTQYSILTNDAAQTKTSIASPVLFPSFALLDAKYTQSLSLETTTNTAIDALSHSIEGMLTNRSNVLTDALAKESITRIAVCFDALVSGHLSKHVREQLLYASTLGGMVIAHTGTTAVHSMGYSLTYFKQVDHGRANGLLLGAFLDFVYADCANTVDSILSCMNMGSITHFQSVLDTLLGKRETVSSSEIADYTKIAVKAKNIANCIKIPSEKDIRELYRKSLIR